MDFAPTDRARELTERATTFLHEHVLPAEARFHQQARAGAQAGSWDTPPVVLELQRQAQDAGLWNLFLPPGEHGSGGAGLSVSEYAAVAEVSGWSPWIMPEAMNCSAPDTGNMELLAMFGSADQRERWLKPLLSAEIRSCFGMTEPDVASSDARNIATTIEADRDGDGVVSGYRVNGRKWWSTGAMSARCRVALVMGVSEPDAEPHARHTIVLVPMDADGVVRERSTTVFGYTDHAHGGHGVVRFDQVRVPATAVLGRPGAGFAMAQARLGPGRIHHCMRLLGMAERAIDAMVRRAGERTAFQRTLAEQGVVRDQIARARLAVDQARLLVQRTAWQIDTEGARAASAGIAGIKAVVPGVVCQVLDDAIQVHGGLGVSDDEVLASLYAAARSLRIADGPDEVHRRSVARYELRRHR